MITPETYARALFEAISETNPRDHEKVLDNFVQMLVSNGDIAKYDQIEEAFKKIEAQGRGVQQADVTTAHPVKIDKAMVEQLNEALGTHVEIRQQVDEKLIGGVVIRAGDMMIDASIKTELAKLKKTMTEE